jgi:hypothetical protein
MNQLQSGCNLQLPAHVGSSLADFYTLKMEAICSSETSVYTISTWHHIPEDGILHSHRRENLKMLLVMHLPLSLFDLLVSWLLNLFYLL